MNREPDTCNIASMRSVDRGRRAAILTRISEDRDDEAEGVDRQREACEKLAADRGLDVVAYFEDNNRSAMHGKRPAYEAMLDAVRAGQIDVILCSRTDRLYRRLADLLPLTEVLKSANVPVFTCRSGDVDLSTADGRMRANIMGSVSQHSSEVQGERVSDAARQRAERGRYSGGQRRFGYRQASTTTRRVRDRATGEYHDREVPTGPLVLVEAEAEAIAWAYEHVARGGSLEAVCRAWRDRGLTGPQGATFTGVAVRDVLLRPINGGIATYKGDELPGVVPAAPPIVSPELFRTVRAILSDPARRTGVGRPALTLLAPVLRCAVCGGRVSGAQRSRKSNGAPDLVYQCAARSANELGGNHVSRLRRKLDPAIEELVLRNLTGRAADLRRPASTLPGAVADAAAESEALRGKLAAYQAQAADMDPIDYAAATRSVRAKLAEVEKRVVAEIGRPATSALVRAADIPQAWAEMSVEEKRAVIVENVERIVIGRGVSGNHGARDRTMENVEVFWR
jgi:site-specific DNA recombinase